MKPPIHLGYATIPSRFVENRELLTPSQRQRFDTEMVHASDQRRRQFCASRELLNQLGERCFPTAGLTVEEPLIAPYRLLSNNNQQHSFNISHSSDLVAVAIADASLYSRIGVDIQTLKLGWTAEKAQFFCADWQIQQGLEQPEVDHYFTQLWCHKEAYFKATQKPFTDKHFDKDAALDSLCVKVESKPVYISLYCAQEYQTHVQKITLRAVDAG